VAAHGADWLQCLPNKQDAFLELVRGFGARVVPGDWRTSRSGEWGRRAERWRRGGRRQNVEAAAEVAAEGKGKIRAAAGDGVSPSSD
jgi:hypothetical protein